MLVKIDKFGGIAPSQNAENLPPTSAVVASDFGARYNDFRPVPQAVTVKSSIGVTNPKTIFRTQRTVGSVINYDGTVGWQVKSGDVDFVDGPVYDDTVPARYYFTGEEAAKVRDTTGFEKFLGVPTPVGVSTAVLPTYYYTADARAYDIEALSIGLTHTFRVELFSRVAVTPVEASILSGLTQRTAGNGFSVPYEFHWCFGFAGNGTTKELNNPLTDAWVLDPRCNGFWQGDWYCLPIHAAAYWSIPTDSVQFNSDLAALALASNPGVQFLSSAQIDSFVAMAISKFDLDGPTESLGKKLDQLGTIVSAFKKVIYKERDPARDAAMDAYFAQGSVTAIIAAAKDSLANSLWVRAAQVYQNGQSSGVGGGN